MPSRTPLQWHEIYAGFEAPVSRFDCGRRCAPHNGGVPVCCSTRHAVPIVYVDEWKHLEQRTDLWHLFRPYHAPTRAMDEELTPDVRLIECKGVQHCQREYRSLSCRAFPFFPYLTRDEEFIGLSYYWTFEKLCWVISNLQIVTREYLLQFVTTYDLLLQNRPEERQSYREHSAKMRRVFSRWKRSIPLLHRDGGFYWITPGTGQLTPTLPGEFPRHGPYREQAPAPAAELP